MACEFSRRGGVVKLQKKTVSALTTGKVNVLPDPGYTALSGVDVDQIRLQSKNILPGSLPYTFSPDANYDGLGSAVVQKPSALIASNIRSGVSLFGVSGTYEGDSATSIKRIIQSSPPSSSSTLKQLIIPVPQSSKRITAISFYCSDSNGGYADPSRPTAIACASPVLEEPVLVGSSYTVPKAYEVYGNTGSYRGYDLYLVDNSLSIIFSNGSVIIEATIGAQFGVGYYTFAIGLG